MKTPGHKEWEGAKGRVICKPVSHLPTKASYPGSDKQPWNEIPIGEGANGVVTWDVTKALTCLYVDLQEQVNPFSKETFSSTSYNTQTVGASSELTLNV